MDLSHCYGDSLVMNNVDLALLMAIDYGDTLIAGPSNIYAPHRGTFFEVETQRTVEFSLESGCTVPLRDLYPNFENQTNFEIRKMHFGDTDSSMLCVRYAAFLCDKRDAWPPEMRFAEDMFRDEVESLWRIDWGRLHNYVFETREQECKFVFDRLYVRYAAYMKLTGFDPVHMDTIWLDVPWGEAWPCDEVFFAYERQLASRYPFHMQLIERVLLPDRVFRRSYCTPMPFDGVSFGTNVEPVHRHVSALKRTRKRGTEWQHVCDGDRKNEHSILLQSLDMPCLTGGLSPVLRQQIEDDISNVVVEKRFRGENNMAKPKSEMNMKRSKAPMFRYGHASITTDVLQTVLQRMNVKHDFVNGPYAPSRATCVCCLLFVRGVSDVHWPNPLNFPRRALRR